MGGGIQKLRFLSCRGLGRRSGTFVFSGSSKSLEVKSGSVYSVDTDVQAPEVAGLLQWTRPEYSKLQKHEETRRKKPKIPKTRSMKHKIPKALSKEKHEEPKIPKSPKQQQNAAGPQIVAEIINTDAAVAMRRPGGSRK